MLQRKCDPIAKAIENIFARPIERSLLRTIASDLKKRMR
jgi:hypothetical protein